MIWKIRNPLLRRTVMVSAALFVVPLSLLCAAADAIWEDAQEWAQDLSFCWRGGDQ